LTEPFGQFEERDVMPPSEVNLRGLPFQGQNTFDPHRASATVIAFHPALGITEAAPSSSRRAGRSRGADPSSATVLPFLLSRFSPLVQWVPRSQSVAKSAKRADQKLITAEEEYQQRMFENLLATAWVGTLMGAGYYMLNALAVPM
jgi:hypothetical protein